MPSGTASEELKEVEEELREADKKEKEKQNKSKKSPANNLRPRHDIEAQRRAGKENVSSSDDELSNPVEFENDNDKENYFEKNY